MPKLAATLPHTWQYYETFINCEICNTLYSVFLSSAAAAEGSHLHLEELLFLVAAFWGGAIKKL